MLGNGKHGNPEPETFEILFSARPELNYKIHLTYSPEKLKNHRDFDNQAFKKVLNQGHHLAIKVAGIDSLKFCCDAICLSLKVSLLLISDKPGQTDISV